jgi:hypothetical protein
VDLFSGLKCASNLQKYLSANAKALILYSGVGNWQTIDRVSDVVEEKIMLALSSSQILHEKFDV